MNYRFFSIIVPAHNEERLINGTLSALSKLDYPHDRYEIIVVENGSNDTTYEKCKKYQFPNFKVFHLGKSGVSLARNYGQSERSLETEWCITVDSDTILKEIFLRELNDYLNRHDDVTHGMATLTPDRQILKARFWFWYRNQTDKMLKTLDTIHIVRADLITKVKYDETFHYTEDLQYAAEMSKHGNYFFMPTKSVISSTRRYEEKGYLKMFFMNLYIGFIYTVRKKSLKDRPWQKIR